MSREFVNLHAHSNLGSMLDGLHYVHELFDKVKEVGQKAVALTDHGTLAGHFDAWKESKRTGVKFLPGCEMYFVPSYDLVEVDGKMKKPKRRHLVLLAQNEQGYKNLLRINFIGFQNQHQVMGKSYSVIDWDNLVAYSEGLIVTSACANGPLSKLIMADKYEEAKTLARKFADVFDGRFFLEIHPHALKAEGVDQHAINQKLIQISEEEGLPLIAAVDAHYPTREMEKYHDMLIAVNGKNKVNDPDRFRYGVDDFYVKSADEVYEFLAKRYGDEVATQAMQNTVRISEMCENPNYLEVTGNHLPNFPVQDEPDYSKFLVWKEAKGLNLPEDTAYMRFKCIEGFKKRFANYSEEDKKIRWERVKEELKVLEGNNFSSYMLVVADFIKWAKSQGILVGPGRGCLTGETLVLTNKGFKELKDIKIGDFVFTHNGNIKEVKNTFEYEVDEQLLQIKTDFAFGKLNLTDDHEILVSSKLRSLPQWKEAKELKKGDYLFVPHLNRNNIIDPGAIDLSEYISNYHTIQGNLITKKKYDCGPLSNNQIAKHTGLMIKTIGNLKNYKRESSKNTLGKISDYLKSFNLSIEDWICDVKSESFNRYIPQDENWFYVLGKWVGDGFISDSDYKYVVGFSLHSDDKDVDFILNYFKNMGFTARCYKKKNEDAVQIEIVEKTLFNLFSNIFPSYKRSSDTKHYPLYFRSLSNKNLISLIKGHIYSDGSVKNKCSVIRTTSKRLMLELRESLYLLNILSSVVVSEAVNTPYKNVMTHHKKSYSIRFTGINEEKSSTTLAREVDSGNLVKISEIKKVKFNKVYDIKVKDDFSYLTSNGIVHNSAGGCMVAYLLGIHTVDPIKYGLLFERFQNAQKKDLPDIDIDFTSAGRDMVQEYVRQKYGRDRCAQVSNINTYTPKNVIPDLVKSMREILPDNLMRNLIPEISNPSPEHYFKVSNKIKDAINPDAKNIDEALESSAEFQKIASMSPELVDYARKFIGMPKEYSTHAAAMVISDIPILDFAPLRIDKNGAVAVQFEKGRCEAVGLVKMDFLAISTLDIIDECFKNIARLGIEGAPRSMEEIPLGDKETYTMIQKGQTRCVFQLGKSGTMAGLCKNVKPNSILDIAAINALGRPSCGPVKLEDGTEYSERKEYIMRREGRRKITYLHPSLEIPLKETFGMCIMEEQLMGVAREVAGWNLNKADGLRKLTKLKGKKPELAAQLRQDFIRDSMTKHNMEEALATEIWERVVEKFSGYGFNRSHAVFYSLIGYYTAFLKKHYPAPFLAAYLKIRTERGGIHKDDEIAMAKTECRRLKVKIVPPDINRSGTGYDVLDDNTIVMGFAAIKGLGDKAVNEIVNKQPYSSFVDFIYKTDGRAVNKSKMEALSKAGCFDSLNVPRKCVHDEGKSLREKLNAFLRRKLKDGYNDEGALEEFPLSWKDNSEWSTPQKLKFEQEAIGELVSGTIHDLYPGFFLEQGVTPLSRIRKMPDRAELVVEVIIKCLNREFKIRKSGRLKGKMMVKYQVEDVFGTQNEMTVWPDLYGQAKKLFKEDVPLRAKCRISEFEGHKSLMLEEIQKCLIDA